MSDREKLKQLELSFTILKQQAYSKPKLSKQEKDFLVKGLVQVAEGLSEIMGNVAFGEGIKEKLATNSRKQLYGIKKVLDSVDGAIKSAKSVMDT